MFCSPAAAVVMEPWPLVICGAVGPGNASGEATSAVEQSTASDVLSSAVAVVGVFQSLAFQCAKRSHDANAARPRLST